MSDPPFILPVEMFADAYEQASKFTAPVAISSCTVGGEVTTGLAAFVVVNTHGWILTAAHIFEAWVKGDSDRSAIKSREDKLAAIDGDDKLPAQKKKTLRKREREDPGWFRAFSYWWGMDGLGIRDVSIDGELDLAVGRLEPFDASHVDAYPTFHSGKEDVCPVTSVCRLGFSFPEIAATYDDANGTFNFPQDTLPIPRFPNDGIITRDTAGPKTKASNIEQRSSKPQPLACGARVVDQSSMRTVSCTAYRVEPIIWNSGSVRRSSGRVVK